MQYANRLAEQVDRPAHHAIRGEVWAKAVTYCRQTGAKAAERSDSREAAEAQKQQGSQVYALRLLGDIAAHHTPPAVEEAERQYREALTLAEALGMRPLQAHCHSGPGMLYAKLDQRQQARAALATAVDLYCAMDMTFWLPEAKAALAQVEGR
jgi:sugar phosphate isomerase/epimerase